MSHSQPFDLIIVGGGPVGWASALAAARASQQTGAKLSVALVDRQPTRHTPSGLFETRVYTVTDQNLAWCHAAGVHFDTERCCSVERIRVFDQAGRLSLDISERDARRARLAAVIEHDHLTHALATRARALGVRSIEAETRATGVLDDTRYVELASGEFLSSKLVVIAEGARSALRDALALPTITRDYERFGVVAHFKTTEPHRGQARQWFLPDRSILALLPLPDVEGAGAVSMVWSCDAARADQLRAHSREALCVEVTRATRSSVHIDTALTDPAAFPLRMLRVADPVAPRALVVGDAAHAIHPLAGQGVNLGLGDAIALEAALLELKRVGGDAGHALLLAKFRRLRYAAVLAMQAATDGLARLYNLDESFLAVPPTTLAAVGDAGMRVLGRLPAFRRAASSLAS